MKIQPDLNIPIFIEARRDDGTAGGKNLSGPEDLCEGVALPRKEVAGRMPRPCVVESHACSHRKVSHFLDTAAREICCIPKSVPI